MAWRVAHSLSDLRAQVNRIAPGRSKKADGTIGDAAHSARASDHNPDYNGIVRALDLTDDPRGGLDALWLREALRESRDPRIKYLISEGEICNSRRVGGTPAWQWRPYTGPNGHFHHLHISVQPGPAGDRPGPWSLTRTPGAPVRPTPRPEPPTEEDWLMSMYASREEFERRLRVNVRGTPITFARTGQTTTLEGALSWLDQLGAANLDYAKAVLSQDRAGADRILTELAELEASLPTTKES